MTNPVNYGFLTRDGFVEERKSNHFKRASFERQDHADLINGKRIKGLNTLPAESTFSKQAPKSSWWKSLFGKQKKKSDKTTKPLQRHDSDGQLVSNAGSNLTQTKANRARKCQSMIENRSMEIFNEVAITSAENIVKIAANTSSVSYHKNNVQHLTKNRAAETSTQNFKTRKPNIDNQIRQSENCSSSTANLLTIKEENATVNQKQNKKLNVKNEISKPSKPPRKNLSLKNSKTPVETFEEAKLNPKVRRSKSLLSLRNIFTKKNKHNKTEETKVKKISTADEFVNDLNHKFDCMTSEKNSYNIYEKCPRRNQEHHKFLIHIQTREEMPIKDGVPQWDSQSYKYVSQRPRPRSEILGLSYPYRQMTKLVESSFIGRENDTCDAQENQPRNELLVPPLDQSRKDGNESEQHHVVQVVVHANSETNLEKETYTNHDANNLLMKESTQTRTSTAEETHTERKSSTIEKMEDENVQAAREFVDDKKLSKGLHLRSSSLDNSLFGCSFVLTGVSSPEKECQAKESDAILSKHPYLAESTPLRRMANCLRQASASDMPKKLSPIQGPASDFPPPPASWSEVSEIEATPDATIHRSTVHEATNRSSATNDPAVTNQRSSTKYDSSISSSTFRQRRCHSESDLSSFYISPMKLTEKIEDESFGKNVSRNTRTNVLLNRMRDRIERLEKLSDTSSACQNIEESKKVYQMADWSLVEGIPGNNVSTAPQVRNKVFRNSGINTLKRASLLRNSEKPETSFNRFKKLISNRLEKGKIGKASTLLSVPGKLPSNVQHERMASEPIYDYIWPRSESETSSELSLPHLPNSTTYARVSNNQTQELTKLTYSSANHGSISSVIPTNSWSVSQAKQKEDSVSLDKGQVMLQPQQFLSSTPIKNHGVEAKFDIKPRYNELHKVPDVDGSFSDQESSSYETKLGSETDDQEFDKNDLKDEQNSFKSQGSGEEIIRMTMLEEMQRISTKYCAHEVAKESDGNTAVPLKFEDWKDKLRFRWEDGFYNEHTSSESDTASQSTLKRRDSDASSSGDTLVNDFGTLERVTTRSDSPKLVDLTRPTTQYSYRNRVNEYVISYDENDVKNFMDWDCDETDL